MKLKTNFKLRTLGTDYILTAEGPDMVNFNKMVYMNSTAAFMWRSLEGKEFTAQEAAAMLVDQYEVSMEVALADTNKLFQEWLEAGILEA